jgi:hypothetical protein
MTNGMLLTDHTLKLSWLTFVNIVVCLAHVLAQ